MTRFIRIFSAIAAAPFLVGFYLNVEVLAAANGWDVFLLSRVTTMDNFLLQSWFFALATFTIGFGVGVWSHYAAVKFDRKHRDTSLTDARWAYGIKNISVKHAACALSGISPREYEASPRAQAISGEIIAAGNSGLLATSIQMDAGTQKFRWFSPDDKLRFIVDDEFTTETMVETYELCERFKGESWETAWARPNASQSLE